MNNVKIRDLHRDAMERADQAFRANRTGEQERARTLFEEAFSLESQAANHSTNDLSRSVLYRSAATLALHAGLLSEAEQMVAYGLTSNPPPEIADELREVFEKVNFNRHLQLRGIQLSPHELQMTIVGDAVSEGMAPTKLVLERITNFEKLVYRTAQRVNNRPFGKYARSDAYNLYMSVPRAGSFAVTLRMGEPHKELLPFLDDRGQVIDELINNLELLNENKIDELRQAIPNQAYYESFLGTAKSIAPDGENVSMVGVTALRNGYEISVSLSIIGKEIKPIFTEAKEISTLTENVPERVRLTGELLFADATGKKNKIRVIEDSGTQYDIEVSEAIAEDVVRPFFGRRVVVDAIRLGDKKFAFQDINPID